MDGGYETCGVAPSYCEWLSRLESAQTHGVHGELRKLAKILRQEPGHGIFFNLDRATRVVAIGLQRMFEHVTRTGSRSS